MSGLPGTGSGSLRLLVEAQHAVRFVDRQHAEFRARSQRHLDDADGDVRLLLHVEADHRAVVHLVDVVAREHEHVQRPVCADDLHVLPQRVGRALVPVRPEALLRRDDLDELAELAAQVAPAALDVLDERVRLVLRQHGDLPNARVDAVREHEIDDAELAAERRRRLAAILGEIAEPLASAARHDHRQRSSREPAQVTPGRELSLLFGGHVHAGFDSRRFGPMLQTARPRADTRAKSLSRSCCRQDGRHPVGRGTAAPRGLHAECLATCRRYY